MQQRRQRNAAAAISCVVAVWDYIDFIILRNIVVIVMFTCEFIKYYKKKKARKIKENKDIEQILDIV